MRHRINKTPNHERSASNGFSKRIIASLGLLATIGCYEMTGIPDRAVAMQAPAQYAAWWRLTEECSGRTIDTRAIHWYSYPGTNVPFVFDGDSAQGVWLPDDNAIIVSSAFIADGQLVRHEMLHALLHTASHPRDAFRVTCGGIVACEDACARDGGADPVPPPGADPIDIKRLTVSGRVFPPEISLSADAGWRTIIVSVSNPGGAGWVRLPRIVGTSASATYGYVGENTSEEVYYFTYADSMPFLSGETKRFAIDRPGNGLAPGVYTLHPYFNIDTAGPVTYSIRP
jgi:hypothetical protein